MIWQKGMRTLVQPILSFLGGSIMHPLGYSVSAPLTGLPPRGLHQHYLRIHSGLYTFLSWIYIWMETSICIDFVPYIYDSCIKQYWLCWKYCTIFLNDLIKNRQMSKVTIYLHIKNQLQIGTHNLVNCCYWCINKITGSSNLYWFRET